MDLDCVALDLLWVEVVLFWVVAEGLVTVAEDREEEPDVDLDTVDEDLVEAELEEEREEPDEELDLEEEDEDLVEPLCDAVVVDLRV